MELGRFLLLAAGATLITATAVPTTSQAAWRRVHAGGCSATASGDPIALDYSGYRALGGETKLIICPLEDTSEFSRQDIDHINVHTYDTTGSGGNFGRAYACSRDPFSIGGECGTSQTASGSGYKTLVLSTSAEISQVTNSSTSSYFASVRVSLVSKASNWMDFYGYWVSD